MLTIPSVRLGPHLSLDNLHSIACSQDKLTKRKLRTKPPVHIPIINVDIPNPNPDAHDKVRLFNPEGKPIGDFNTPIDWTEVKKAVQEDILKHKN